MGLPQQIIRLIVNAIFYITKEGLQWRMMPNDLPNWSLVYYYFRTWFAEGTVQKMHEQLVTKVRQQANREASPSLGLIDSQSVKSMSLTKEKGFDGVEFIDKVKSQFGLLMEVVYQVLGLNGFTVSPKRWIVERTFGWFSFHRRLAKDYELKTAHAEAFIYWTMIRLMSRKLRGTIS